MNQDNNDKDKKEQTKKIYEKIAYETSRFIGIVLHKNFGVNILLQYILNLLIGIIVIGMGSEFLGLVDNYEIVGILIGFLFFTLFDLILKLSLMKFMFNFVVKSFGSIFNLTTTLAFYLMSLLIPTFELSSKFGTIFIFAFIFEIIKNTFLAIRRRIILGGSNVKR